MTDPKARLVTLYHKAYHQASNAVNVRPLGFDGASYGPISIDESGNLQVDIVSGGGGGTEFTEGLDNVAGGLGTLILGKTPSATGSPNVARALDLTLNLGSVDNNTTGPVVFGVDYTAGGAPTVSYPIRVESAPVAARGQVFVNLRDSSGSEVTALSQQYAEGVDIQTSVVPTGTVAMLRASDTLLAIPQRASPDGDTIVHQHTQAGFVIADGASNTQRLTIAEDDVTAFPTLVFPYGYQSSSDDWDRLRHTYADYDTGAGSDEVPTMGVALPASGGHVIGGTATNPFNITPASGHGLATATKQDDQETTLNAIQTAVEIMDDWDETDRAKVNPIVGQAGVAGGSGTVGSTTQRVIIATDADTEVIPSADQVYYNGTLYTKKQATSNGAATGTAIVSAVASKKLVLLGLCCNNEGEDLVVFTIVESDGGDMTHDIAVAAGGGGGYMPFLHEHGTANDAMDLEIVSGTAADLNLTVFYIEVD